MSETAATGGSPRRAWAFSLALVAVGLPATAAALLLWEHAWPGLLALGFMAAFTLADRFPVYYEFRDNSLAVSLTEAVATAGFFVLAPGELLVARVVGGLLVSHLLDRTAPVKRVFNTGLVLIEGLVSVGLFVLIGGSGGPADPRTWAAVMVALVATTLVDALAIRTVMRLATGDSVGVDRATVWAMILATAVSASTVLAGMILKDAGTAALLLLVGPAVVLSVGHRSNVRIVEENKRIRGMYELATRLSQAPELDHVLVDLMTEARRTLRAQEAELLVLADTPGAQDLWIAVNQDGQLDTTIADGWMPPKAHARALRLWSPDTDVAGSLHDDVLAIPISTRTEIFGSLVVRGRRPRAGSFDRDDLAVLAGVASQLAGHVSASRLRHQLQTADDARRYLASHDVLTGLPNRKAFAKSLLMLGDDTRAGDGVAVLALNLKRFRQVNESMGNHAGDAVLVMVADRLRATTSHRALITRVSGDEFLVADVTDDPEQLAETLRDALIEPLTVEARPLSFAVAIGVAHWPTIPTIGTDPLACADLALTVARSARSSAIVRYSDELETTVARRARIASRLPAAIAGKQIKLHYQPVVDLSTEQIVAVEALARWKDAELGFVSPAEFISVAEEIGEVAALTDHVLEEACAQTSRWNADGLRLGMAVNVSAHDLEREDIQQVVAMALTRHGISPGQLMLEVTETAVMTDRGHSGAVLRGLRQLGAGIAIDDFGIGQSSLAYLRDLPATKLKIDQSFVRDITTLEDNRGIIQAIIDLAQSRGLEVVAEGIEDREVFDAMRDMGAQFGQGYFMARPLPAHDIYAILRSVQAMGFPAISA